MVQLAARRFGALRGKSAEEIRRHRQCRFLRQGRHSKPVGGVARRRFVLGKRRRSHFSRRQSAYQAAAVLGVDDCAGEGALSGRDLFVGGLHPPQDDVPAGEDRLLAVLHLFHLAEFQEGAHGLFHRARDDGGKGILSSASFRQYARHQSLFSADLRPARISHPRGARRHAVRPVGPLFRIRALRSGAAAGPRGISRLRKIRNPRSPVRRARQHHRGNLQAQPHPQEQSGAAKPSRPAFLSRRTTIRSFSTASRCRRAAT